MNVGQFVELLILLYQISQHRMQDTAVAIIVHFHIGVQKELALSHDKNCASRHGSRRKNNQWGHLRMFSPPLKMFRHFFRASKVIIRKYFF